MTDPKLTFYLHCGQRAAYELQQSMLLDEADRYDLPLTQEGALHAAGGETGFAVIGYADGDPVGYIVGEIRTTDHGEKMLFLSQSVTKGKPEWSRMAQQFVEGVARNLGCSHLAMTAPMDRAMALSRRYGFDMLGVYMTKRIKPLEA